MRISSASLGEGTEAQVHRERRLPSPPWLVRSLSLSPPHRLSYRADREVKALRREAFTFKGKAVVALLT